MTGCGNPIGPVVATHSLIKIPISKDQDIKIKISRSKISKSNIPINIKLKDSEIYQTPKLSDFLQKFACSNLLKLSQISCNFLEFKYSQNSPPQTMLSSAVIFSRWSWVMSRDHWSLLVSQQESQGSISPPSPHLLYIIQRQVNHFITRAGS